MSQLSLVVDRDDDTPQPFRVPGPGIYEMTADQYHADPCPEPSLSSSIAWLLLKAPAKAAFSHPRLNPDHREEVSEDFDIGKVSHEIVLRGARGKVAVVQGFTDWRTKEAQQLRDQVRASGKIPLLEKTWKHVFAMTQATRAQLDAHEDGRAMFRDGKAEQVLVWTEQVGRRTVWCRAMLDYLRAVPQHRGGAFAIDDYKSTRASANPADLARSMPNGAWPLQAAFYARGVELLTGEKATFRFAVQECFAPYLLSVIACNPSLEMLAEVKQYHRAVERWAVCLEDGAWPGYGTRTAFIDLPPWVEAAALEAELRDEQEAGHGV
jgi:hypothetical protein